jgi:hypothetical protein
MLTKRVTAIRGVLVCPKPQSAIFRRMVEYRQLAGFRQYRCADHIVDDEEGFFKVARQSQQGFQVHFIFLVSECCNVAWYGLFEAGCFIFSDGLKLQAVSSWATPA